MPNAPSRIVFAAAVIPLVFTAGCDKENAQNEPESAPKATAGEAEEPAPEGSEPKEPSGPSVDVAAGGPFEDYDLSPLGRKLQGVWLVGGSTLGQKEAWKVEGSQVTIFDGEEEKTYHLEIVAPCRLKVKDEDAGTAVYSTFTFDGDTLYKGLGSAGARIGDDVVACASGKYYVLSGDTCTEWKETFGRWEKAEAECAAGADGFALGDRKLEAAGDAFVNQQMRGNKAESFDDFEAAREALAGE